jgi:sugar-specific transcriptional regulator TrmB
LNNNEIIDRLKSIGFKEYEAKIFFVLLNGSPMAASDIANEAKLIRNSIYDTLKSFTQKGYCNEIETNTVLKYQIINPRVILDKIEDQYTAENNRRIDVLKSTFENIEKQYNRSKSEIHSKTDNVEMIRGFNKHRVIRYIELLKSAKKEVLGMNRIRGLVKEELNDIVSNLVSSGGSVKTIYNTGLDFKIMKENQVVNATNEDLIKVCEMFERNGEEIRLTNKNIPNAVIIDGMKAFINITGARAADKNKQTDLIVNDPDFTENMIDLFQYYWDSGMTIEEFKKNNINN